MMSRSRLLVRAIDLSVIVLLAACVAAMLQEIVGSAAADSEMTAMLTDANFEQYKAKEDGMLVEFFVSWCGHCKRFTAEFSEAATIAKRQKLKIMFGLLNAEDYQSLASRFKVQSFPSVRLFKGDTILTYEGPRNAASIVNWTISKMNFRPEVVTIEEFNEIKENENLLLVFFGPEDSEFEQYKEFGRTLEGFRMLHVNYKKPGNRIDAKYWPPNNKHSIVLFRNQGQKFAVFSDKVLSFDNLNRFLDTNRSPLLGSLNTDDAIDRVFHRNGLNILFFIENSKDSFLSKYIQLARNCGHKANFILVKKEDKFAPEVREFLSITNHTFRQIWAIEVNNNVVESYFLNKSITARHVHRFLNRVKSGRMSISAQDTIQNRLLIDLNTKEGHRRLQHKRKTLVVFNFKGSLCSKRPSCLSKLRRFRGFAEELHSKPSLEFCLLDFDKRYKTSKGKFYHQFRSEMPALTLSGGFVQETIIVQDFDWRFRTLERLLNQILEDSSKSDSRSKQ
jgi:thiol-disulfide isomerase/thioredoxin